ncbi:hypothetical protein FB451DRAFT_1172042 [Mycena latifolia]|nr:hypothetical protein FB451DRAFT_1172042 [Mycena latifolia]
MTQEGCARLPPAPRPKRGGGCEGTCSALVLHVCMALEQRSSVARGFDAPCAAPKRTEGGRRTQRLPSREEYGTRSTPAERGTLLASMPERQLEALNPERRAGNQGATHGPQIWPLWGRRGGAYKLLVPPFSSGLARKPSTSVLVIDGDAGSSSSSCHQIETAVFTRHLDDQQPWFSSDALGTVILKRDNLGAAPLKRRRGCITGEAHLNPVRELQKRREAGDGSGRRHAELSSARERARRSEPIEGRGGLVRCADAGLSAPELPFDAVRVQSVTGARASPRKIGSYAQRARDAERAGGKRDCDEGSCGD